MNEDGAIKPMKLRQSLFFFLLPGLYGVFAFYVHFPNLMRLGMPEEFAYGAQMISVFLLLFLATIIGLLREGRPISWGILRERLRIKRMDSAAWKWTLSCLFLYLISAFLLNLLGQFVYEKIGFWPLPDAEYPSQVSRLCESC